MRYTVRWVNSALADLTQIWLDANDRASVTAAVQAIDEALSRDPLNCGESREEDRRIFFVSPLAITLRVDSDRRQVVVLVSGERIDASSSSLATRQLMDHE